MFFSPFGILSGLLSFAGAAINVAWGVTKMAAKATAKAIKGAIKVGRFLYKQGKPLGRKVIKTIKSCSGAMLSGSNTTQRSHLFTKPEQSTNQLPPKSKATKSLVLNTSTNGGKQVAESTTPLTNAASTDEGIKGVASSVKRANVFTKPESTHDLEQTKSPQVAAKSDSTGSTLASGAVKVAVAGASVVAPEIVVATKAGIKTASVVGKVGKGLVSGARVLANATDKSATSNDRKPTK